MRTDPDAIVSMVRERLRGASLIAGQAAPYVAGAHWHGGSPSLAIKPSYALHELVAYSDRAFVENAYRALLRREPEPEALSGRVEALRSGSATKIDVLADIRWSAEGVARGVHVDGLLLPTLLHRWARKRWIGPLVAWLHAFLRLPDLVRRIARAEASSARDVWSLANHLDGAVQEMGSRVRIELADASSAAASARAGIRALSERLDALATCSAQQESALGTIPRLVAELDRLKNDIATQVLGLAAEREALFALRGHVETLAREVAEERQTLQAIRGTMDAFSHAHVEFRDQLGRQSTRVDTLEFAGSACAETLERLASEFRTAVEGVRQQIAGLVTDEIPPRPLDALYVAFEERFRGSSALIRQRVKTYLEDVREAQVGKLDTPVVDVGSGNGDWLAVLRENGYVARGIDSNAMFAELCHARGLHVQHGDALDSLRAMPSESVGAVTALHVVEHLPFDTLVELLDEAYRVLCRGGLLILETPNPENLLVGAHYFYTDPTHRNPIPPATLHWLVEARGYARSEVRRLTEAREIGAPAPVEGSSPEDAAINAMIGHMSAAPDYAVIARKL